MKNQHLIQWSVLKYVLTGVLFSLAVGAAQAGLVAQWNFNEGSGTSAAPAVGVSAGAVHGAAALKIEGSSGYFHTPGASTNDYIELGRGDAFNLTNRYSLETWFRVNGGSNTMIIGKHYSLFSLGYVVNSASRYFEFYTGGGANSLAYGGVERGEWYHVVAAYDGSVTSGTNMWLYVNGELAASKLATNITLSANTGSLMLAQNQYLDGKQAADADWDQVAIYDHALTAEEVAARYIADPVIVESQGTDKDAAGPDAMGNTYDVLSQVREFRPRPDAIRADQKPRVMDWIAGRETDATDEKDATAYFTVKSGKGFSFRVAGDVGETRTMWWSSPVRRRDISAMPYYLLRYKAHGQRRDHNPLPVIAVRGFDAKKGKAANAPLLDCSEVINDGQWHTIIGKLENPVNVKSVDVQLSTESSEAALEIDVCSFYPALPNHSSAFEHEAAGKRSDEVFQCLDLSSLFNDDYGAAVDRTLKTHGRIVDGGNPFAGEMISAAGIPFAVRPAGKNIIVPPGDPNATTGTVSVLGVELEKKAYKPATRDDLIAIPATGKAREVCFILVADKMSPTTKSPNGKIPARIDNDNMFVVELVYAGGDSDFAIPYSIADKGFGVQRFTGAYAVPADPVRELKAIVFHNRYYGSDFDVAAVTLNTGRIGVIPASVRDPEPYRAAKTARPEPQPAKIVRTDKGFTLENGDYLMEVDATNGFAISRLTHKWSPKTDIALKGGGLEIQIGGKLMTGRDFTVDKLTITGSRAEIELKSKAADVPLAISLTISGDSSQEITFNAAVKNNGNKPLKSVIRFPVLEGLSIGDLADTWMFFPQFRNVLTKEYGTHQVVNGRGFLVQFFDVFNPKSGIGLAFLTHNLDADVLEYALSKDASGVKAFIQYWPGVHVIPSGGELKLKETCLVFHGGDWHEALSVYQEWVKTWFKPVKSGGLDWWDKLFNIRSEWGLRTYHWTVPIFDPVKQQFRTDDIFREVEGYTGARPDMISFYGWLDGLKDKREGFPLLGYNAWNSTQGGGNYYAVEDLTGGPDVFRAAIRDMQNKGVRVSLYTIPDRYSKDSRIGKSMGAKFAQVRSPGGKPGEFKTGDYWKWDACIGSAEWRDIYIQALKKIQQETGADIIYVDTFPYHQTDSACCSGEHGHEVPLNVNKACHELISRLRAELPEGVAIWSELACADVDSQFINGNITYYPNASDSWPEAGTHSCCLLDPAPAFSRVLQSVYRFAFPRHKQFGLYADGDPKFRFLFFNGEGLMDTGFLFWGGRNLPYARNWLAVQKECADCFSSPNPTPLVETEAGEVYANEFPGNSRTAWTFFNGRFATYRGPVLVVEHKKGDTYYDAWNHKELLPEIRGGKAVISLALDPQGVGCVIRKSGKN